MEKAFSPLLGKGANVRGEGGVMHKIAYKRIQGPNKVYSVSGGGRSTNFDPGRQGITVDRRGRPKPYTAHTVPKPGLRSPFT